MKLDPAALAEAERIAEQRTRKPAPRLLRDDLVIDRVALMAPAASPYEQRRALQAQLERDPLGYEKEQQWFGS